MWAVLIKSLSRDLMKKLYCCFVFYGRDEAADECSFPIVADKSSLRIRRVSRDGDLDCPVSDADDNDGVDHFD